MSKIFILCVFAKHSIAAEYHEQTSAETNKRDLLIEISNIIKDK